MTLGLLFLLFLFLPLAKVWAQDSPSGQRDQVNVYFFWGEGCPHCAEEKVFLEKLKEKYPQVEVHYYEVWHNKQNRDLMVEFGKELRAKVSGVPFTVIGENYFIGWVSEDYTGAQIEEAVECNLNKGCQDIGLKLLGLKNDQTKAEQDKSAIPEKVTLPWLGEVKVRNLSLPALTIILGALDGFNPCAMWALLFLITLLLGMEDKKRVWILGSAFIFTSGFVYFLFMAAWLNLILFIGMVVWLRTAIGLLALTGGSYNLKKYFSQKEAVCQVDYNQKKQKTFEKIKLIVQKKQFWLALTGIIILAAAVNLIELICSAGLPVIFTQILALSNLAQWQYYLYLLFYIFIFILDDLLVFFAAMTTLRLTGITSQYTRWSYLIGGCLMLAIGLLLIFKPEWLMFG